MNLRHATVECSALLRRVGRSGDMAAVKGTRLPATVNNSAGRRWRQGATWLSLRAREYGRGEKKSYFLNGTLQITLTGTVWPSMRPGSQRGISENILIASRLRLSSMLFITCTWLIEPSVFTTNEHVTRP